MEDELYDELEIIQSATRQENLVEFCSLPSKVNDLHLFVVKATDLSLRTKFKIMSILEGNMRSYYERTSWGWNEAEMNKETLHSLNRFVILSTSNNSADIENDIVAFAVFRFDWDDEDEPEYPVLYLYQLQIMPGSQRTGLGRMMMELILQIAGKTMMRKVLLTCFKINGNAMEFYKKIGFVIDGNSPSQCGYTGEPYEILSKKSPKHVV